VVELQIEAGAVRLVVQGLHQLLALRRTLEFPLSAVRSARRLAPSEIAGWWKGWRMPGTHVPGVLVAGTYYKNGQRHFWDVRRAEQAIAIELEGDRYDRLFVEVEDPEKVLSALGAASGSAAAAGA
jgi:hypothetical protein